MQILSLTGICEVWDPTTWLWDLNSIERIRRDMHLMISLEVFSKTKKISCFAFKETSKEWNITTRTIILLLPKIMGCILSVGGVQGKELLFSPILRDVVGFLSPVGKKHDNLIGLLFLFEALLNRIVGHHSSFLFHSQRDSSSPSRILDFSLRSFWGFLSNSKRKPFFSLFYYFVKSLLWDISAKNGKNNFEQVHRNILFQDGCRTKLPNLDVVFDGKLGLSPHLTFDTSWDRIPTQILPGNKPLAVHLNDSISYCMFDHPTLTSN